MMESSRRNESDIQLIANQTTERIRSNSASSKSNSNSGEWKRAIPEAGYITLGTIRYGVKLNPNPGSTLCLHSRSTSLTTPDADRSSSSSEHHHPLYTKNNGSNLVNGKNDDRTNIRCDSDNSSCDVPSVNGSCCLNASKIPLPWLGKMDHEKVMTKNRTPIGVPNGRNPPNERRRYTRNVDQQQYQQPFSTSDSTNISDKSLNVNSITVQKNDDNDNVENGNGNINSNINDTENENDHQNLTLIESNRESSSSPIGCYNSISKINTNKLCGGGERKQQTSNCRKSRIEVAKNSNNRKNKNHHLSPTQSHRQRTGLGSGTNTNVICECGPFQSCHNRKFTQTSNALTNNNNNEQKLIDANPVKNFNNDNESFFGRSHHNDQCCYCCYSDCKKDLKLLSCGNICDVRSFDCYQPRSNKPEKCCVDSEFEYLTNNNNINNNNNNNCELYRNQNSGQSICGGVGKSSEVFTETDTVGSTKQSVSDVLEPFHSSQFYIDAPSSSYSSTWDQSNKCAKINNKIDLASIPPNSKSIQFHRKSSASSHRRHHSASDSIPIHINLKNCSDCIGQLDKELINRIKCEQTNPLSIFDEQKLVCCAKNVTAVRKLPQLFTIGNACELSISDQLATFDNNNRLYGTCHIHESNTTSSNPKHLKRIDRINGTPTTITVNENIKNINSNHNNIKNINRALTSIPLARKESHSEKEKNHIQNQNHQFINYNCAAVRSEHNLSLISSNFQRNSRKNGLLKTDKTHHTATKYCDDANDNDNKNDEPNLCHSKKLNLANRKICSSDNTTTITNHQYKIGATPAAHSHEIICNAEISKQNNNKTNNNYQVKNGERKLSLKCEHQKQKQKQSENVENSVTTIAYATPANILVENTDICENLCENERSPLPKVSNVSNIVGSDLNSIQFEENILLSDSNQTIANDECILFEHKPIIPSNSERDRFLQRRASFDNHTEGETGYLSNLINHRRTYSSGTGGATDETLKFDRFSRLNRSCIESFSDKLRFIQNTDHRYAHSLTATIQPNSMEKRRNTLDRWQRLRFGRRAASNPPEDKKNPEIESAQKRSSDKTERLRELTELLKVPRNSSNPGSAIGSHLKLDLNELTEIPPLPPPRKQRPSLVASGSIEKFIDTSASESSSPTFGHKYDHSVIESKCGDSSTQSLFYIPMAQRTQNETLRSNASVSNLDNFSKTHDKSAILLPEENISTFKSSDSPSKKCEMVQRTESKPMSGCSSSNSSSCTSKSTPFRSASFSQIDYSSGKYIRSALGALKASFAKARSPPIQESISPKKDRSRSSSPDIDKLKECTDIWIPLKDPCDKRNNLNLDLIDAAATSNIILEEENENSPTSVQNAFGSICDKNDLRSSLPFRVINAAEMTVDTPHDEGVNLHDVDDIFQTVNADMIPTPVFECAPNNSNDSHLADKWINACEVEIENVLNGVSNAEQTNDIPAFTEIEEVDKTESIDKTESNTIPEVIDQIGGVNLVRQRRSRPNVGNSDELRRKTQSPTLDIDDLPAIAVTPGSSISGSSFEEVENGSGQPRNDTGPDYVVEVRKRNSNEDKNRENRNSDSTQSTSTSGTNSPKSGHNDEKRRIDKSKRRKGIYIQWAALDKHNKELNAMSWSGNETPLDLSDKLVPDIDANGQPIWPIGAYRTDNNDKTPQCIDNNSLSSLDPISPDFPSTANNRRLHRMDSIGKAGADEMVPTSASYDAYTPDSDCGRQPIWPSQSTTQSRRQSLSLQSSEEKDESQMSSSSPPKSKGRSKIFLLRSDSISDNELSDRGHLSRDRASQSPAPDQDLKRYSKRPLRGPYGQMLEAEMKKPAKQNYDGLLEELNRSESPYMLSAKNRDSNLTSCEDIYSPHYTQRSISMGKPSTSKAESSLPLPLHARAASTPAHMETPRPETIQHHHKRYPSCVETSPRKDTKKFSMDSYHARNVDDRHNKRALSESKEKIGKRNASSPAAISLLNVANEKLQRFSQDNFKQKSEPIKASPELLAELLKGSSEKMTAAERQRNKKTTQIDSIVLPAAVQRFLDTRTHIVVELFNTEKSYVESLETVVKKYLNPLKSPENASLIENQTVDEIFLMVPTILHVHQQFLDELRGRLEIWEPLQRIGDAFVQVFSTSTVLETYTLFVNNVNRAKAAIRTTCNQRPAFVRFLETMAREHKGKLTLDNLLIKPVQKFPNYELMFQRLIKHTDEEHPDQKPLQEALKLVHDILLHLNCKEREALENDQREATLRELESVIEGISDLVSSDRQFLSFDLVSMPHGQGGRKERGFFLFNDLLIITSIKRRSGTIKKPSTTCPTSVAATLDTNKYKLLMKVSVQDLDIIKAKDENVRRIMREIENLTEDCTKLQQMLDVAISLRSPHQTLEENIRELHKELQRQLNDRQTNDSQLCVLELAVNQTSQPQHMTVVFPKSEKRTHWEKIFNEIKQKLLAVLDHQQPIPKFIASIPIRKTRAGLQFTCASATLGEQKDVWICNSDGYVGQVCVLNLNCTPEPTVTSCNGVSNSRILCVASVPSASDDRPTLTESIASLNMNATSSPSRKPHGTATNLEKKTSTKSIASNDSSGCGTNSSSGTERDIQLDSSSSSDDSDELEQQQQQQQPEQQEQPQPLRRLNSAKASSTPQLSSSAPNSSDHNHGISDHDIFGTMWLGTEDGILMVFSCHDNIRTKKNKIKIQLVSAIYSILYLDDRVFVSLANGELVIYSRDYNGGWNTTTPHTLILGSATNPISKLINVNGKLWCSVQGTIKVLNSTTLQVENQMQISPDIKPITNMAVYTNQVWISVQNSASIKCFHSKSLALLFEVNLAPSVNKMLSNCDDIIRQHKAACLRVTSLLACKDLIFIGTSAGVILTIPCKTTANIGTYNSVLDQPIVTGIPYGHTGHVRFLTCVDYAPKMANNSAECETVDNNATQKKKNASSSSNKVHQALASKSTDQNNLLIISGGDGFEDFRTSSTNALSDIAGREDSTNHLLLWQV